MDKIRLEPVNVKVKKITTIITFVILILVAIKLLDLNYKEFYGGFDNAWYILKQFLKLDFSTLELLLKGMVTSIALAFSSLFLAIILATMISVLSASNIAPNNIVGLFFKSFIALIRTIPTLVWGLMIIAAIGFGNVGGVITLFIIVTGFLVKSFVSSIEDLGTDLIETFKSSGSPWIIIILKGIMPTVFPALLAWIAIGFEMAMVTSISLGMIGVEGIGYTINKALGAYNYGQVSVGILIIFVTMFTIELSTVKIKSRIKRRG